MTYNQDIITVIEQSYTSNWVFLSFIINTVILIGSVVFYPLIAPEDKKLKGFDEALIVISLIITLYSFGCFIKLKSLTEIYVEPSASIEQVQEDFILVEQKDNNIWLAKYISKMEDYEK